MRHILAVTVHNYSGVLNRVAGLFSRRGYNIESLNVGTTDNPQFSRMTIVVEGDNLFIEQVVKQLHKLVDVIKVSDITEEPTVNRDLVLYKVAAEPAVRGEIMQICEIFRLRVVDFGRRSLILEATGEKRKLDAIEDALRPFGILEMVRTGQVSMVRGKK